MSQLRKIVVVVRNYKDSDSKNSATAYKRVRAEDEAGATIYFKALVIPDYINKKGAFQKDVPRTWYVKETTRGVTLVIGFENSQGEFFYDRDEIKEIASAARVQGVIFTVAAIPASIIMATATFGLGVLFMPFCFYYGYRFTLTIPSSLSQATLQRDFQAFGVKI